MPVLKEIINKETYDEIMPKIKLRHDVQFIEFKTKQELIDHCRNKDGVILNITADNEIVLMHVEESWKLHANNLLTFDVYTASTFYKQIKRGRYFYANARHDSKSNIFREIKRTEQPDVGEDIYKFVHRLAKQKLIKRRNELARKISEAVIDNKSMTEIVTQDYDIDSYDLEQLTKNFIMCKSIIENDKNAFPMYVPSNENILKYLIDMVSGNIIYKLSHGNPPTNITCGYTFLKRKIIDQFIEKCGGYRKTIEIVSIHILYLFENFVGEFNNHAISREDILYQKLLGTI